MEVAVADTSAFVALLLREPDWEVYETAFTRPRKLYISALTLYETLIVLSARQPGGMAELMNFIEASEAIIVPFDAAAAAAAHDAYLRWGKGSGSGAKLNLGDCAAYALAVGLSAPLLYKGGDFARTDVVPALSRPA